MALGESRFPDGVLFADSYCFIYSNLTGKFHNFPEIWQSQNTLNWLIVQQDKDLFLMYKSCVFVLLIIRQISWETDEELLL